MGGRWVSLERGREQEGDLCDDGTVLCFDCSDGDTNLECDNTHTSYQCQFPGVAMVL